MRNVCTNDSQTLLSCPFCGVTERGDIIFQWNHEPGCFIRLLMDDMQDFYTARADGKSRAEANRARRHSFEESAEAWNARVAVTDYEFSAAVHDGGLWRKERTCHMERQDAELAGSFGMGYFICSDCQCVTVAHKGHSPSFCSHCGAKVVG